MGLFDSAASPNAVSSTSGIELHLKAGNCTLMTETGFRHALGLESKRAERSGNPALLLLFDLGVADRTNGNSLVLAERVITALLSVTRETDFIGWYAERTVLGAVFTELSPAASVPKAVRAIAAKVEAALQSELGERNTQVRVSSRVFSGSGLPKKKTPSFAPLTTHR